MWQTALLMVMAIACIAPLSGCADVESETSPPVAKVGERVLTVNDLEMMLRGHPIEKITPKTRWDAVERWIERELLYREALKRGIQDNPLVQQQIDVAMRELVINALLLDIFSKELAVSPIEINNYYETHRTLFRRGETSVWVKQIVVENIRETYGIHLALRRDKSKFEAIAREKSIDPSAAEGGDIGFVTEETAFNPAVWKAIRGLGKDQTTRTIRSTIGYHIFIGEQRRAVGSIMSLDEVKPEIINRLRVSKREALMTGLVERLKLRESYAVYQDRVTSPHM